MVTNRIITRGMGTTRDVAGRAGLITQGYGGPPPEIVIKALERIRKNGKTHKETEDIVIWAKLTEINNTKTNKDIKGSVRVKESEISKASIKEATQITYRLVTDTIKVFIKRLK